jgi:hypothetical protein
MSWLLFQQNLGLGGGAGSPFSQQEWPNPRRAAAWLLVSIATLPADATALPDGHAELTRPGIRVAQTQLTTWSDPRKNPLPLAVASPFTQSDWPLPPGLTWSLGLETDVTLAEPPGTPFAETEWPLPSSRVRAQGLAWTFGLQPAALTPSAQNPLTLPPGPNPERARVTLHGSTAASGRVLDGQDQVYGQAGQVPGYDYPNPRGTPPHRDLRTWTQSLLQSTLAPEIPSLKDWPIPNSKPWPIALRTHLDQTRLLLLGQDAFFTGAGRGPSYDWPVPRAAARADIGSCAQNLQESTLGSQAAPFVPGDWPNPRTARTTPPTWTDQVKLTLLGRDQFFGAAGQGPAYDYPNPRGRDYPVTLRTWTLGLQESTLPPSTAPPFVPGDFPNPRGRDYPVELRTWLQTRKTFYVDLTPANQFDWPNPRIKCALADNLSWSLNLQQSTLRVDPFALLDWPTPTGKPFPLSLRTWLDTRKPHHVDQANFSPYDWPNPRPIVAVSTLRTWLVSLNTTTLFAAPPAPPYLVTDWPNPRGPVPSIDLRTHLQAVRLTLLGKDQFFGAPGEGPVYEYPNPRGIGRIIDLGTWVQGTPGSPLVLPTPAPFSLSEWPNPRGVRPAEELRTFLHAVAIHLIGQDAFFNGAGRGPTYDYPNPRGRERAIDLRTWVQTLGSALGLPAPLPFSLKDWPNPRGPRTAEELKTFLEHVKLQLIGRDVFFGGPGQPPANLDWPNPQRPKVLAFWRHHIVTPNLANIVVIVGAPDVIVRVSTDVRVILAREDPAIILAAADRLILVREDADITIVPIDPGDTEPQ